MKIFNGKLNIKAASTLFSAVIHLIIGFLFVIFYSLMAKDSGLIEVGFGEPGGGSGGWGEKDKNEIVANIPPQPQNAVQSQQEEPQSEDLPEVKAEDKSDEKISITSLKNKKEKTKTVSQPAPKIKSSGTNKEGKGIGDGTGTGSGIGDGNGNGIGSGLGDGFGIEWGGRVRKIYNYYVPPYPEGVSKEIDVKLRFSIMPDGSVGNVTVIKKADNRLEQVAIEALRQWHFEPLPKNSKQEQQITIITFPFRLN